METVLFACVRNAGCSRMAAAFFNTFLPPRRARAFSAEARPALSTQAEIVDAMREVGVDLRRSKPRQLSLGLAQNATLLVLMGCRDEGSADEHAMHEEWFMDDPAGKDLVAVRRIRDKVRRLVFALIEDLGWARATSDVPAIARWSVAGGASAQAFKRPTRGPGIATTLHLRRARLCVVPEPW